MDALDRWNDILKQQMDEDDKDWDEEDRFWELMMFTGPLAITNIAQERKRVHGGSRPGRRENLVRKSEKGVEDLWNDYFAKVPTYGEMVFRRRYRMSSRLFNRILEAVCAHDDFFY